MNRSKRILLVAAAVVLLAAFTAIAIAVQRPAESNGGFQQNVTDRVRFAVDRTDFKFEQSADASDGYEFTFTLSAEKTEADFYAVIHSVTISGAAYESIRFQTVSDSENLPPEELMLPAENGKTKEVRWEVTVRLPVNAAEENDFQLIINYTSGITPETADEHFLEIPLHITVS